MDEELKALETTWILSMWKGEDLDGNPYDGCPLELTDEYEQRVMEIRERWTSKNQDPH